MMIISARVNGPQVQVLKNGEPICCWLPRAEAAQIAKGYVDLAEMKGWPVSRLKDGRILIQDGGEANG